MAQRRMFAKTIIDSDAFLDMPSTAQLLYFHLSMRADDDGFINQPKSIMRMTGCKDDDIKLLIAKKFLIPFETGVVVIKHWKIHNYIRNDRYTETKYKDEKALLSLDENNAYTTGIPTVNQLSTDGIPMVDKMDTQDRLGKDRIDKVSIVKDKKDIRHKYGEYKNVLLSDEDYSKLINEFPNDYKERIERLSEYMASTGKSYKNHLATIRNWSKKDKQVKTNKPETDYNRFMNELKDIYMDGEI